MQALLMKEYLVNRKQIVIDFIFLAILILLRGIIGNILYLGILLSCFSPISSELNEGIDNDILINSLPVSRGKIVLSKYLYSLLTGVFYLVIVFLISLFNGHFEVIRVGELSVGFLIIALYLSAYYPLKYLVGKGFAVFSFIGHFIILSALVYSVYIQGENFDYWGFQSLYDRLSTLQIVIGVILFSSALLTVSYRFSRGLYNREDLK